MKKPLNLTISIVIVLAAIVVTVWLLNRPVVAPDPNTPPEGVATEALTVGMECEEGKNFSVTFVVADDSTVDLDLNGEVSMTLSRVSGTDGARYTNTDGSLVFWTDGNGAFIEQGGSATYNNCMVSTVTPDWMM